jgi:hypothetical protein
MSPTPLSIQNTARDGWLSSCAMSSLSRMVTAHTFVGRQEERTAPLSKYSRERKSRRT